MHGQYEGGVSNVHVIAVERVTRQTKFSPTAISHLLGNSPAFSIGRRAHHGVLRIYRRLNCRARREQLITPRSVTMLSTVPDSRRLDGTCCDRLHDALVTATRRVRVALSFCASVGGLVSGDARCSNFMSVNPRPRSCRDLRELRRMLPRNIFVSIGPTPGLFDSIRPSLLRAVLSTLDRTETHNVAEVKFVNNRNHVVNACRCPRSVHAVTCHS